MEKHPYGCPIIESSCTVAGLTASRSFCSCFSWCWGRGIVHQNHAGFSISTAARLLEVTDRSSDSCRPQEKCRIEDKHTPKALYGSVPGLHHFQIPAPSTKSSSRNTTTRTHGLGFGVGALLPHQIQTFIDKLPSTPLSSMHSKPCS